MPVPFQIHFFKIKIWQNQNLVAIYKMWIKLLGNAIQIAVTITFELVNDPTLIFWPNVMTPTWTRLKLQKMMRQTQINITVSLSLI